MSFVERFIILCPYTGIGCPLSEVVLSDRMFHMQVGVLLDRLGLHQYREAFELERINGSLLMELDDGILSNELHMCRRLDRIRLLLIIQGKRRVVQVME